MVQDISWVKTELAKAFNVSVDQLNKGVDLNRSGGPLQDNEKIRNFNGNKTVGDEEDWRIFLEKNKKSIHRLGGIFSWSQPFRTDNPIHDVISIESKLVKNPQAVKKAYQFLKDVLREVKKRVSEGNITDNQKKLKTIFDVMQSMGVSFKDPFENGVAQQAGSDLPALFLFNVNDKNRLLDCDNASLVVLAVSHEMGWPVSFVPCPLHAIVRWQDPGLSGSRFNMDFGKVYSDQHYKNKFKISGASYYKGVYLQSLNRGQLITEILVNRAMARRPQSGGSAWISESISDLNRAIALDLEIAQKEKRSPRCLRAYLYRGQLLGQSPKTYGAAIKDFTQVVTLDPNRAEAYYYRAYLNNKLGNRKESRKDAKIAYDLGDKRAAHLL